MSPATVIPGMRYRNAPQAIDWLCQAFGFKPHLVVPGENGTIAHAQLTFGNGMVMLGSLGDRVPGAHSCYVIVPEIDAHYRSAVAAGATIVIDIKDEEYGGRGYTCHDLEGHEWSFGSYNPWSSESISSS